MKKTFASRFLLLIPAAMILAACGGNSSSQTASSGSNPTQSSSGTPASSGADSSAAASSSGIVADPLQIQKVADFAGDYSVLEFSDGYGNGDVFNVEWRAREAKVENDQLSLSIHPNDAGRELPYGAGQVRSKMFYGYGDFSTRMKPAKVEGTASTFFTYTGEWDSNELHPSTGVNDTRNPNNDEGAHDEVDIEFLGKDTTKVQFNYFTNGQGGHEYMYDLGFDASLEFHTYGFRWEENCITWFVDGVAVYQATENIPTHPGRIYSNYWAGNDGAVGWMGNYTYSESNASADYLWFSSTAVGEEIHYIPEPPVGPTTNVDWDEIDDEDLTVLLGADADYHINVADDNKSATVSYENIPGASYKNLSFAPATGAATSNRVHFTVKNNGEEAVAVRVDVDAAEQHGENNITAINTSATLDGTVIPTDLAWGGSSFSLAAGATGELVIAYDGVPVGVKFFLDSASYGDTLTHTGNVTISGYKVANVEEAAGTAVNLAFGSIDIYTCATAEGATTITYESVSENTYANVYSNLSGVPEEATSISFDVENKGDHNVKFVVMIGQGGASFTSCVADGNYDWYDEGQKQAQLNVGPGASRTFVINFDQTDVTIDGLMMFVNSGWAEETHTYTNGNIVITNAAFNA